MFVSRLDRIFETAEDREIDVPHLWKYLGELMGPTAFEGNLNPDELFKSMSKYVPKHKAAKLFAHMLLTATNCMVRFFVCLFVLPFVSISVCLSSIRECESLILEYNARKLYHGGKEVNILKSFGYQKFIFVAKKIINTRKWILVCRS